MALVTFVFGSLEGFLFLTNSGVQNSFRRIRPQIRVLEAQSPLCGNLSLTVDQT